MQENVNPTEGIATEDLSVDEYVHYCTENIMRDCKVIHGMIAMLYNRIIDTVTHSSAKYATDEDIKTLTRAEKLCFSLLQEMRAH